jgi:hypothetical protein
MNIIQIGYITCYHFYLVFFKPSMVDQLATCVVQSPQKVACNKGKNPKLAQASQVKALLIVNFIRPLPKLAQACQVQSLNSTNLV